MTSKFARSLYATTAVGFALGFMATPAFAQDATADASATATDDAAAKDDADAKEIVVTGFRASLQSAVNTKKRQDQIVESVSAEDIGKLPDNSIAESIARLPGLAAQRTQGRASIISIRGFGPDFSVTTLNGREQTTTNDSRSVEFDQFPSEVMNQVLVYKSPSADLVPQGLVGTVDLRTIRPLDAKKRVIAVGGRGTYIGDKLMPDAKNKGWRAFATYVDQFADDRVGVALSASYTDEPYQTEDFQAWGFSKYNNTDTFKPDGIKQWFEASSLKRLGLMGTLQAELSDSVMMTWDGFYSNFKDHVNQRGIEWPGNNLVGTTTENGFLTGGTWTGIHPIVEGYANDRDADLYSLGWNTKFDGHNGWKGMVDFAWSRTDRTDHRLESTIGTGYSGAGPATAISYDWTDHGPEFTLTGPVNFGDPSQLVLTDTQGWGWTRVQAGYDAVRDTRDDIKQARAEIERELDGGFISSVKAGLSYADRSKTLKVAEGFLAPGGTGTCLTGSGAIVNTPCQIAIPADAIVGTFDFMRGIGPLVAYDPRVLVDNGTLVYDANLSNDVLKRPYKVSEKVLTPYVMATIKASLGASDLTGNIGIQAVHTDQSSEGVSFLANGTKVPTKVGIKYWEYLPSLNLALRQPSGLVFRLALAREMMRARLPDMASNLDYGTNVGQGLIITGSGGNPYIKPYMANAIDFNIEKYFGNKGYISLQTFYKKITRYISRGTIEFDYSDLPPPSGIPPISNIGTLNTLANTKGGKLYGFEVAGTLPFDVFTQSLDGFGLTGGLSYTKTKVRNFAGQIDVIPGYSKWVGNLTAYYEKAGFNVRGSMRYRDGFKGEFRDYKGDDSPQFVLAETIFDAQVGYDFSDTSSLRGLSLYLQGQNLTNERLATVDAAASPDDIAFLRYQTFGRRWVAGFTYKFGAERAAPAAAPAVIPPPPPPAPATQTCADGSVILATDACPPPPPPPPPPAPAPEPERG